MQRRALGCLVAGLVLQSASAQTATNLIQNPGFDNGLMNWTIRLDGGGGIVQVDNSDGSPAAPSAQLVAPDPGLTGPSIPNISQCSSLTGVPPPWNFSFRARVVNSTGSDCTIVIRAHFFNAPCGVLGSGTLISAAAGGTVPGVQGNFTQYAGTVASDPMPGGSASQSASLDALVICNAGSSMTLDVDSGYFGDDVIFADGFE